jgi:hypothetical protein
MRLRLVWLRIRRRGFALSVWQWISVHANEGETDGNRIRTANCQAFKQTHGTKIKHDLKKVILLDSQSTMDLICDPALVESTFKSSHSMRLKSNGGTLEVKKQAIMPGYHAHVWYNKKPLPTFSL